eukprot:6206740-Pleurochrysis_carterae.AAC.3
MLKLRYLSLYYRAQVVCTDLVKPQLGGDGLNDIRYVVLGTPLLRPPSLPARRRCADGSLHCQESAHSLTLSALRLRPCLRLCVRPGKQRRARASTLAFCSSTYWASPTGPRAKSRRWMAPAEPTSTASATWSTRPDAGATSPWRMK